MYKLVVASSCCADDLLSNPESCSNLQYNAFKLRKL